VMLLLRAPVCVMHFVETPGCRDGLTSAVHLIPKLWPFLRHSIGSVRQATLRTVSVLLDKGKLKVGELVSVYNF